MPAYSTKVAVTPVLAVAGVYAAGDVVGSKLTLAGAVRAAGGGGIIQSVRLADKAKQNAATDVVFFAADPATSVFTDNAVATVADADLLLSAGHVSIAAADYASFADNSLATVGGVGLAVKLDSGVDLFAILVTRGAPTYANGDLELEVTVLQD